MGILINDSQIGGDTTYNSFRNIGEIFYTMRTDTILNGAVECDGSQYNFTDFPDIKNLLDEGKLPYLPIDKFDSMVTNQGVCGSFGYGTGKTLYGLKFEYGRLEYYTDINVNQPDSVVESAKVYDLQGNLLEGWYLRYDPFFADLVIYNNEDEEEGTYYGLDLDETIESNEADTPTTYFKVPKLSNIFIESGTNTNIGNYVEAGLPNITATLPADDYNTYGWAGAFYEGSTVNPATRHLESMPGQYHPVYFDASRCSSIYGKSTTVQPPAVLYRTMIQLKN